MTALGGAAPNDLRVTAEIDGHPALRFLRFGAARGVLRQVWCAPERTGGRGPRRPSGCKATATAGRRSRNQGHAVAPVPCARCADLTSAPSGEYPEVRRRRSPLRKPRDQVGPTDRTTTRARLRGDVRWPCTPAVPMGRGGAAVFRLPARARVRVTLTLTVRVTQTLTRTLAAHDRLLRRVLPTANLVSACHHAICVIQRRLISSSSVCWESGSYPTTGTRSPACSCELTLCWSFCSPPTFSLLSLLG